MGAAESAAVGRPAGSPEPSDPSVTTRERLLLAAERLIADDGLAGVSLRRINAAAGQRNASAVHYHFGSLEAVIAAIFEYRMPAIDRRRNELLDEVVAAGRAGSLEAVVQAVVRSIAEQITTRAGGSPYIRFVAAASLAPSLDSWGVIPYRYRRGLRRAYAMCARILSDMPGEIVHARLILAARQIVQTLADVDRVVIERHPDLRDELVRFHACDLVSRTVGALSAPVSDATGDALRALKARMAAGRTSDFGVDAVLGPPPDAPPRG